MIHCSRQYDINVKMGLFVFNGLGKDEYKQLEQK